MPSPSPFDDDEDRPDEIDAAVETPRRSDVTRRNNTSDDVDDQLARLIRRLTSERDCLRDAEEALTRAQQCVERFSRQLRETEAEVDAELEKRKFTAPSSPNRGRRGDVADPEASETLMSQSDSDDGPMDGSEKIPRSGRKRHYASWKRNYQELCEFYRKNGHANVPTRGTALGRWVEKQRQDYHKMNAGKNTAMTAERLEALEDVGFVWKVKPSSQTRKFLTWEQRLEELKEFKEENGDVLVPRRYPPNQSLSNWVNNVRAQCKLMEAGKTTTMTAERAADLESLGLKW